MFKFLSKLFKREQRQTIYTAITVMSLGTTKTEYRCKNCRMIIPTAYPHCPFCGLKAVNSSYTLHIKKG